MAVTRSYDIASLEPIDLTGDGSLSDIVSLAGGGFMVMADDGGESDTHIGSAEGGFAGAVRGLSGSEGAVAQLGNGNLVLARDEGGDVAFSITTAEGNPIGDTQHLGEIGNILDVDVAAGLTGDRFVIALQERFNGTEGDVELYIRNTDGSAFKALVIDSSVADDSAPSVATLADGGFAVAWHRTLVNGNTEMWCAVYNGDGTERKEAARLDNGGSINRDASVVALEDGGFAIAYEDNGWGQSDTEITLARMSADGDWLSFENLTKNLVNDTDASAALLSNGMIVVGSSVHAFGEADSNWTLADHATGNPLAEGSYVPADDDEVGTMVAGLGEGQFASFHNVGTEIVGSRQQVVRITTGDNADDTIIGDELSDHILGGGGQDIIRGGANVDQMDGGDGNDTFILGDGDAMAGEAIHGGAHTDRIVVGFFADLTQVSLESIEEIEFDNGANGGTEIYAAADQFGPGLDADLLVDGRSGATDVLRIYMGDDLKLNLRLLEFEDFGFDSDILSVTGDDHGERVVGSTIGDVVIGNGGNDILDGRGGRDHLFGGLGDDRFYVNFNHEAQGEGLDGGGDDAVFSTADYELGHGIERLFFQGAGLRIGYGNELGNAMTGNDNINTLDGKLGRDTLTGAGGADRFQFSTSLAGGNYDRILDFEAGADEIRLSDAIFDGLNLGALNASAFRVGIAAQDANDRIIYNKNNGALFFDADGAGGADKIRFATVEAGLNLSAGDFRVIDDALIPVI